MALPDLESVILEAGQKIGKSPWYLLLSCEISDNSIYGSTNRYSKHPQSHFYGVGVSKGTTSELGKRSLLLKR